MTPPPLPSPLSRLGLPRSGGRPSLTEGSEPAGDGPGVTLPDRAGHEWRAYAGLIECHLCGAVRDTPGGAGTCEGSAAEPMSMECRDD